MRLIIRLIIQPIRRNRTDRTGRVDDHTHADKGSSGTRSFQLSPAAGVAAVMVWWRGLQARAELIPHLTNVGALWR
jgi:hypothetical protein